MVASYFLDTILGTDGSLVMPMLTQSDPGTENFGIANAQIMLRQMLDPGLEGTMQHIHSQKHSNIKPAMLWGLLCKQFAPGLEKLLTEGLETQIFNPDVNVQK
ncbi:hypothetical protein FRC12_016595 [Ceratobasidium sp. 428]|nr:hypothetical protein FRC12_016595 [Ceratobasidium sp. 428]